MDCVDLVVNCRAHVDFRGFPAFPVVMP